MNQKMKIIFLASMIMFSTNFSIAQSIGVTFYAHKDREIDKEDLMDKIMLAKRLMATCDTSACTATKLHFIASVYYALDYPQDTVISYLDKALKINPQYFCGLVKGSERISKKSEMLKKAGLEYFITNLSEEWRNKFYKTCDNYIKKTTKQNEEIIEVVNNPAYLEILKKMMHLDQKYRANLDSFHLQAPLDKLNRIQLDSLYKQYGFPSKSKTSIKGSEIAWYILQHSTDCEWNKKWFIRFLEAYQNKECEIGWLDASFKRFYDPINGYCSKKDIKDSQEYINELIQKFPEEYSRIFGYGSFQITPNDKK